MMRGSTRAAVTAATGTGVALCLVGPRPFLVATIALIGVVIAIGWVLLLDAPFKPGSLAVLIGTAVATSLAAVLTNDLAWAVLVLAGSFLGAIISELCRRDSRAGATFSMASTVSGAAVIISSMGWLTLGQERLPVGLALCAAVSLIVASLGAIAPVPMRYRAVITVLAAGLAGAVVGFLIAPVGLGVGGAVGLCAALLTVAVWHMVDEVPQNINAFAGLALGMIPVALAGAPVYVLWRVIIG